MTDSNRITQAPGRVAATAYNYSDNTLWMIHVLGPDDIYAAPSLVDAYEQAAKYQRFFDGRKEKHEHDPVVRAVVTEWDGTPEQHAHNVATYWKDFAWQPVAAGTIEQPAQNHAAAVATLSASVERLKKLPVWDGIDGKFHAEIDVLFAAIRALSIKSSTAIRGAGILKNHRHSAGAYARCSYCGRYSDNPDSLNKKSLPCDCGKLHGWCGSFVPPDAASKWSDAAPT